MSNWLLRGIVFAAGMVIVRLLQGALINTWETRAGTISAVLVVLYIIAVFAWGLFDGRRDARANPDPDRRADLAMTWLLAGLFAGFVSGLVAWIIGLFYNGLYVEALMNEVTTFAAFTALMTFLFGIGGVALGRYLVDRKAEPYVRRRAGDDREDRADTDVFAAVGQRNDTHDGTASDTRTTSDTSTTSDTETTRPVEDYSTEKTVPTTQHGGEKA